MSIRLNGNGILSVVAPGMNSRDRIPLADLRGRSGPDWTRYVRGSVALVLEQACELSDAELLIDSDHPIESGLSSSASLQLGVALALSRQTALRLTTGRLMDGTLPIRVDTGVSEKFPATLARDDQRERDAARLRGRSA